MLDDCAVYDIQENLSLVVGTDFVRGTNFTLFREHYLDDFDMGYYLVVAISVILLRWVQYLWV